MKKNNQSKQAPAAKQCKIRNRFMQYVIESLLRWKGRNKERAFFIVLSDKGETQTAYQNLEKLTCDAPLAISIDTHLTAAFEDIKCGVDILTEGMEEDPKWIKELNEVPVDTNDWYWGFNNTDKNESGHFIKEVLS